MKRESFRSRLGFLLVSAGCAIGIGNVGKFTRKPANPCNIRGWRVFLSVFPLCFPFTGSKPPS